MTEVREATADLLANRPGLEDDVRALLSLDADGPWTFDDAPLDSGTFGEVVSRGLVEETDAGYRIADRDAVAAALDGETIDETASDTESGLDLSVPDLDRVTVGAVGGSLLLVVLARIVAFPSVFRGGDVVLVGNDPYAYRYWTEALLAQSTGFDPSLLGSLPTNVATGEPLFVVTLWLFSTLFGGTTAPAGTVLAWYPVIAGLASAGFVYLLAVSLTDDRRVALAAVLILAVIPSHAFRTGLGFADHHAFDYLWLSATLAALVSLPVDPASFREPRTWLASAGVGIGIAGQLLAWEAGALLVVPIGLYVLGAAALAVEREQPPYAVLAPLLAGLGVAAVLTQLVHRVLGWQSETVALVPALLLCGSLAVVGVAALVDRWQSDTRVVLGAEAVSGLLVVLGVRLATPGVWSAFSAGLDRLLGTGGIAETQSLLGGSFGWLLLFGFVLVLALPFVVWGTLRAVRGELPWLLASAYAWYFLCLSVLQIRFAGELSIVVAVFAGLGLVHLAAWIDVARVPAPFSSSEASLGLSVPEPRQAAVLAGLFLLVTSLSLVQVPVKTNQLTVDEDTYDTATWIEHHVGASGVEPHSEYVFSPWSHNRVYNYFVSGDSRSYAYAQNNYESFIASTNGTDWYHRLRSADRDGFVVTTDVEGANASMLQTRLHEAIGSRTDQAAGLAHYRLLYSASDGSPKVFAVVPGATLTGRGPANATVSLSTPVDVPGATTTYRRETVANASGRFAIPVSYPGAYTVSIGGETQTVTVPEGAIRNGSTVSLSSS